MRFTVVWTKEADNELIEIWLASDNRNGVSAASYEIDRVLSTDSHRKGIEISEGLKMINLPPLRFLFTIDEQDRLVTIAMVRNI